MAERLGGNGGQAPRPDEQDSMDVVTTGPAAANTAPTPHELRAQIVEMTKGLSTDVLESMGLTPSPASGPALIKYERVKKAKGPASFAETTEIEVPTSERGIRGSGARIHHRTVYQHPGNGSPLTELREEIFARVDPISQGAGLLGGVLGLENRTVSGHRRMDHQDLTPLHAQLSALQQDPGSVTVTFTKPPVVEQQPEPMATAPEPSLT